MIIFIIAFAVKMDSTMKHKDVEAPRKKNFSSFKNMLPNLTFNIKSWDQLACKYFCGIPNGYNRTFIMRSVRMQIDLPSWKMLFKLILMQPWAILQIFLDNKKVYVNR